MIGDRIKERREALGWSQDELAQRLGYKSRSSINKMELNIQDVPQRKVKDFARVLRTTTSYLLEDDKEKSNLNQVQALTFPIGVFDPISCGKGLFVDENATGYIAVPVASVRKGNSYFANAAEGDSMEPKIHHGDYVIFEQTPEIQSGQIGAFCLNGEYYCKRFRKLGDGSCWLVSENPTY